MYIGDHVAINLQKFDIFAKDTVAVAVVIAFRMTDPIWKHDDEHVCLF